MLQISRPDIRSDVLQEFNPKKIVLPIQPYLELLQENGCSVWSQINPPQIAFINAVNSPSYRFITAAYSRRLGKTFIANVIGQLVFLVPDSHVLIMSPNYNLSNISWDLQHKFVKNFDLEVVKDNSKDKVLELSNKSTIRMGSVGTVDSSVGRSYDLIIFDEAALHPGGKEAFEVALRPTLDKPSSKCVFISTPRGKSNWFSQFYERGFSSEFPQWCSLHATWESNPRVSESDILEAKKSMSSAVFAQEYLASFNTFEGQIYKFDLGNIVEENPTGGESFAGLDPGFRDYTAFCVVVYDGEHYWVVDEYLEREKPTSYHAEKIKELLSKHSCETVFIDSAAAQVAADLAYNFDISTTKSRKDVAAGIGFVQNLVENNKLKVMSHCHHTLSALDQYRWDERKAGEKPVHDQYSHMMDALRYALYTYTA